MQGGGQEDPPSYHYGPHRTPSIELVQQLARSGAIVVSEHAGEMLLERWITVDALLASLCHRVAMLEEYPDDPRGHSCLLECTHPRGDVLQCTCAVVESSIYVGGLALVIVTVYEPE